MTWQETLVLGWIQFAVATCAVFIVACVLLRFLRQPVDRERLIQVAMAVVLLVPVMSFCRPFPSWKVGLGQWLETADHHARPSMNIRIQPAAQPETEIESDSSTATSPITQSVADVPYNSNDQGIEIANANRRPEARISQEFANDRFESSHWQFIGHIEDVSIWSGLAFAIMAIHGTALLYFAVQFLAGSFRLRRLLREADSVPSSIQDVWRQVTAQSQRNVRLLASYAVDTPMVFGWWKPTVVIPGNLLHANQSTVNACLAHEWSHIERGDIPLWNAMRWSATLFFFQPAYWILRRELKMCQEFLADHRSSREIHDPMEYPTILLTMAKGQRRTRVASALNMVSKPSALSRRIRMLLDCDTNMRLHCQRKFSLCVFSAGLCVACVVSCIRIETSQAVAANPPVETDGSERTQDDKSKAPVVGQKVPVRSISYTKAVVFEDRPEPQVSKEYLHFDGRSRSDSVSVNTIRDASGQPVIEFYPNIKKFNLPSVFVQSAYLTDSQLRTFREMPIDAVSEDLKKEVQGKSLQGFSFNRFNKRYLVWKETAAGEPQYVEFDANIYGKNRHVTLSDFHFDIELDEDLFSTEPPEGYSSVDGLMSREESLASGLSRLFKTKRSSKQFGFKEVWSRNCLVKEIAGSQQTPGLVVASYDGILKLDATSRTIDQLDSKADKILSADIDADGHDELITVTNHAGWPPSTSTWEMIVFDEAGKTLWTYSSQKSEKRFGPANAIRSVDLDGDGKAEILVACWSGTTVLQSDGRVQAELSPMGGVQGFALGDADGDGAPELFHSSRAGGIAIDDTQGKLIRTLNVNRSVLKVVDFWAPGPNRQSESSIVIASALVHLEKKKKGYFFMNPFAYMEHQVMGIDLTGQVAWTIDVTDSVHESALCPGKPWIALSSNGVIKIIDLEEKKSIAVITHDDVFANFAWMPRTSKDPLLVVSDRRGRKLRAYEIVAEE